MLFRSFHRGPLVWREDSSAPGTSTEPTSCPEILPFTLPTGTMLPGNGDGSESNASCPGCSEATPGAASQVDTLRAHQGVPVPKPAGIRRSWMQPLCDEFRPLLSPPYRGNRPRKQPSIPLSSMPTTATLSHPCMILSSHSHPQTVCHGYQSFISSFLRVGLEGLRRLSKACQWKSLPKNEFVMIGKLLRLTLSLRWLPPHTKPNRDLAPVVSQ